MNPVRKIRLFTLWFGVGILSLGMLPNLRYSTDFVGLIFFVIFFGWNLLPNLIYFRVTKNAPSAEPLTVTAILLCLTQVYFVSATMSSGDGQGGLMYIFLPIYSGVILGVSSFLILFFNDIKGFFNRKK